MCQILQFSPIHYSYDPIVPCEYLHSHKLQYMKH